MTRFYPGGPEAPAAPTTTEVVVSETITVTVESRPVQFTGSSDTIAAGSWGWEEVRDYVLRKIDERWGAQPRDPLKESGIFKGFVKRWGAKAEPIARCAFEVHNGVWRGSPIKIGRFTVGSDPFFAAVIAKNIN